MLFQSVPEVDGFLSNQWRDALALAGFFFSLVQLGWMAKGWILSRKRGLQAALRLRLLDILASNDLTDEVMSTPAALTAFFLSVVAAYFIGPIPNFGHGYWTLHRFTPTVVGLPAFLAGIALTLRFATTIAVRAARSGTQVAAGAGFTVCLLVILAICWWLLGTGITARFQPFWLGWRVILAPWQPIVVLVFIAEVTIRIVDWKLRSAAASATPD